MKRVCELNKLKVQLFVQAVWNEGRLELIGELVAADYLGRVPCVEGGVVGPQGLRRLVVRRRLAHPDLYVKIEDQIAEDDRVVTRWRTTADRAASLSGRTPCWTGISITR